MARRSIHDLGSLQRAVIEVVWREGEVSVNQVLGSLPGRKPAYTTVLTVLQKLERAGWIKHRVKGRAYLYRAVRSRRAEGIDTVHRFLKSVFAGDPLLLFEHLLESDEVGPEELAALQRMLEEHRKEARP